MTNFLDKFKMKTSKKIDGTFVKGEDLKEFQDLLLENSAWVETIRETLLASAKARHNLKTKALLFWRRIIPKYHLDKNKVYDLHPETGEVTLSKNQNINKGVKK